MGKFSLENLAAILNATQSGLFATVPMKLMCERPMNERGPLKGINVCIAAVELMQVHIDKINICLHVPERLRRVKPKKALRVPGSHSQTCGHRRLHKGHG